MLRNIHCCDRLPLHSCTVGTCRSCSTALSKHWLLVTWRRVSRWKKKRKKKKINYPRVGVGDGHLYNTTSSQCSVMTEDYCAAPLRSFTAQLHCAAPLRSSTAQLHCAAPLRSSTAQLWLKMTRHFSARARNNILKINADVYISGFETFAPSAENV